MWDILALKYHKQHYKFSSCYSLFEFIRLIVVHLLPSKGRKIPTCIFIKYLKYSEANERISIQTRVTLAHSLHISPSAVHTLRAGSLDQKTHSFGQSNRKAI